MGTCGDCGATLLRELVGDLTGYEFFGIADVQPLRKATEMASEFDK